MDDSAFTARMFTLRPFADIHVTSLLLHHVAVFLFGLSCARAQAWDAIRLQPVSAHEPCAAILKSM
jgi:hypothetical protein